MELVFTASFLKKDALFQYRYECVVIEKEEEKQHSRFRCVQKEPLYRLYHQLQGNHQCDRTLQ